ncbi:carbon-nitrogen hydrolase [Anaerolineales bacterium]
MRLTVGLAQIYPQLADLNKNLELHLQQIEEAHAQGVQLLVFPELSMTAYQVQDLVSEIAMKANEQHPIFKQLLNASQALDLVIGFVHQDTRNRFYIADAYLSKGEIVHIHHKLYLPTYAMFDEMRYFAKGNHVRAFNTQWGRMGMLICEDFWHVSPAYLLWMDGADIMILNSASPGRGLNQEEQLGGSRWVELVTQAYGSMFTSFIIHANRVGYEDGKVFWGGSSIIDPNGNTLAKAPYFDEALLIHEIDLNQLHRTRSRLPLLRDERPGLVKRELNRILSENLD